MTERTERHENVNETESADGRRRRKRRRRAGDDKKNVVLSLMRERERELVCLRVYLCERVRRRGARGIVGREKRVTGKRVFF